MNKMVQALLSGIFVTFILDFFLFLGIFQNYIRTQNIDLYYNILFVDNQNIFLFMFMSVLLGYLVIYGNKIITLSIIGLLSVLSLATLIAPIGRITGEKLLQQKDVFIQTKKFSYRGDILYDGRKIVTFYDYKFKKVLHLDKNNIVGK